MAQAAGVADGRLDVCLVCSHGGHLQLLGTFADAYRDRSHLLITPPGPQADALAGSGTPLEPIVDPRRNPARLAANATRAVLLVRRNRPRVVLSTGAGVTVPLCLTAKAAGAELIFVETMARVENGSAAGRAVARFADHFLVQWPELRSVYPRAEVCRPALLEGIGAAPRPAAAGTFVATRPPHQPIDPLLRWADEAAASGILPPPVLTQSGPSNFRGRHLRQVGWLTPAEVTEAVAESEVVVAHGGSGLVSTALRYGHRPLVLPRRGSEGEHVDDHQVAVTRKLAALDLIVDLDAVGAADAVAAARIPPRPSAAGVEGPPLARRVAELIEAALER